jgi:hypothetical protein
MRRERSHAIRCAAPIEADAKQNVCGLSLPIGYPEEGYNIFMNNYTEHTWVLVSINDAVRKLYSSSWKVAR